MIERGSASVGFGVLAFFAVDLSFAMAVPSGVFWRTCDVLCGRQCVPAR
jgi:hypothetical protein